MNILEKINMILMLLRLGTLTDRERKNVCAIRHKNVESPAIARAYILAIARIYGENTKYSIEYGGVKKVIFRSTDNQKSLFSNSGVGYNYWLITIWDGYKIAAMFKFSWK